MSDEPLPVKASREKARKGEMVLLTALLAASLSLNVFLGWKVQRLTNEVPSHSESVVLQVGDSIPSLIASDVNDRPQTVVYAATTHPTVLYFFSPACVWCQRNIENIRMLANLREDSYRFIGVSLSETSLSEYLNAHKFDFPIYKNVSPDSMRGLGIAGTPQTIVVSSEGKVLKNWVGAYGQRLKAEVEAYFDISLPGVIPLDKSGESASSSQNCSD
jgi:redoxin